MTRKLYCQNSVLVSRIRNHIFLAAILLVLLLAIFSINSLSTAAADKSEMMKLITDNEDPHMTVDDLAFLLVTHNFDAVPKKDFVEVRLDDTVYKLVPNGANHGLANVTLESNETKNGGAKSG